MTSQVESEGNTQGSVFHGIFWHIGQHEIRQKQNANNFHVLWNSHSDVLSRYCSLANSYPHIVRELKSDLSCLIAIENLFRNIYSGGVVS